MLMNNPQAELTTKSEKMKMRSKLIILAFLVLTFSFLTGCRYDMQDQPRYKAYKQSDFFADKRGSRDVPESAVARGKLKDDKAFYTGKIDNPNPNAVAQTTTDSSGATLVASFPNDIAKIPVPVNEDLVNRGQERYNVYCIVCHGPVGSGDGMIVRRGFSKPPTYHDDRLRNAPDGHFFDVISNGWGKMNGYAAQIPPADRWAIVSYIRALQVSQNPSGAGNADKQNNTNMTNMPSTTRTGSSSSADNNPANSNSQGGAQ